jgi:hypothetical protein
MRDLLIARPLHALVILPFDLIIQHPPTTFEDQKQLLSSPSLIHLLRSKITIAFSCGAQSAFKLKGRSYLRNMLSRRRLQGFVRLRRLVFKARVWNDA